MSPADDDYSWYKEQPLLVSSHNSINDAIIRCIAECNDTKDLIELINDIFPDASSLDKDAFIQSMQKRRANRKNKQKNVSANFTSTDHSNINTRTSQEVDKSDGYYYMKGERKSDVNVGLQRQSGKQVKNKMIGTQSVSSERVDNNRESTATGSSSNRQRFVPLSSEEGQSRVGGNIRIPGRHKCTCLGQRHELINNCLNCGRIVCSQEGSGPCFSCGNIVCTNEEREVLDRNSKKSKKLYEALLNAGEDYEDRAKKAMEHRNKLLEFDRSSAQRTKVIDDQRDYFRTDKWFTDNEIKQFKELDKERYHKMHRSRRELKVTLDIAGRQIIQDNDDYFELKSTKDLVDAEVDNNMHVVKVPECSNINKKDVFHPHNPVISPDKVKFVSGGRERKKVTMSTKSSATVKDSKMTVSRLQDRELQEVTDKGFCLSMHQPWASLLVRGIKIHEGRSWYTPHRGRLWIASTSKKCSETDIENLEHAYQAIYLDADLPLPESYPTGCLLGCIDLVECLEQNCYREKYPNGESESSYVFIVENALELQIKLPIKGQHKIWKLDNQVHNQAKAGIRILRNR